MPGPETNIVLSNHYYGISATPKNTKQPAIMGHHLYNYHNSPYHHYCNRPNDCASYSLSPSRIYTALWTPTSPFTYNNMHVTTTTTPPIIMGHHYYHYHDSPYHHYHT